MVKYTKTFSLAGILLLCLYMGIQCGFWKSRKHDFEKDGVLRLMDRLGPENILTTPLAGLINNFRNLDENLNGSLSLLGELSTSQQKVWCATTTASILGQNEAIPPQGMQITLNNQKIPFLNEHVNPAIQWKWVETSKNIDIKYDPNYNRGFKCLVLDEQDSFSFEAVFPSAPAVVEVYARRNWHPVDLEIYIDEEFVQKETVGRNFGHFRFQVKIPAGTHKIEIKPSLSERLAAKNAPPPVCLSTKLKFLLKMI